MRIRRGTIVRAALLVVGLGLAGWLVRTVGVARVGEALRAVGPFLPFLAVLEISVAAMDTLAARAFAGAAAREVPFWTWVRVTALVYASTILLPAGRAAGEAGRAATFSPYIGAGRATGVATRVQAGALFGNATICACAAVVVSFSESAVQGKLRTALLITTGVCLLAGTVTFTLARSERFGAWLKTRFGRFVPTHAPSTAAPVRVGGEVLGLGLSVGARFFQTAEYALVVAALAGATGLTRALTAQGIHLVGAAVGDVIPSQMGAMEGAFYYFAPALGFGEDRARAVTLALAMRVAQIASAVTCIVVGPLLGGGAPVKDPDRAASP